MTTATAAPLLRHKLRQSGLFQTYSRAFELVTDHRLKLEGDCSGESDAVPVVLGRQLIGYLVVEPTRHGAKPPIRGLLESFSLQLGDEANHAVLADHHARPQTIEVAIAYLSEHLHERVTLEDVSEVVGVCSFQLCRLFKRHLGVTITEYRNRLRVEKARRCLKSPSRQMAEIAEEVGFSSLSQFNRNFLKFAGESPSEFRRRLAELEHCQLTSA